MAKTLAAKLGVKEGMTLFTLHAPGNFKDTIPGLPDSVSVTTKGKTYDQIHWFVKNKAQMEKELLKVMSLLKADITCWIYYPKGSSGIQTDLTRDKGWDKLMENDLQWITLISFDDTWSAFGVRLKSEKDKVKSGQPKPREIFSYIDPVKRTIRLPEDVEKALKKNPKAKGFFESLSFTNKKEYVEWIVSAKKEETRQQRVTGTLERLEKGWKNPRNI